MTRHVNGYDGPPSYRSGRVKDSTTFVEKSEGYLEYISGAVCGLKAFIILRSSTAPEIPNLDFTESIHWEYEKTRVHPVIKDMVTYSFVLDDEDADKLQSVLFLFDTLYG